MSYRSFPATVSTLERLTPNFVRVTFQSPELREIGVGGPDQRIKVIFPLPGSRVSSLPEGDDWYGLWRQQPDEERHPMRTYTIRGVDNAAGELVVDFVAHGVSGPASRWITTLAEPGDRLVVVAPDRSSTDFGGYEWHPGTATTFLIAGDETAVPAICAIVETLPPDARGAVFLEIPDAADALPVTVPPGVDLHWLARGAGEHGASLAPAVRSWVEQTMPREEPGDLDLLNPDTDVLWEVPAAVADGGLYAWLAGEAGLITGLRRTLVRDFGVDKSRVAFMGYWKLGRAEN